MTIKITCCSDGGYWYNNSIGSIYDVKAKELLWDGLNYRLINGSYVLAKDVEEVKETKMKVVEKVKEEKQKYPCLRINAEGTIFLATNSMDGIVLKSKSYYTGCPVTFNTETFLYSGTLELSNGD